MCGSVICPVAPALEANKHGHFEPHGREKSFLLQAASPPWLNLESNA
jgi:hypothetical protein